MKDLVNSNCKQDDNELTVIKYDANHTNEFYENQIDMLKNENNQLLAKLTGKSILMFNLNINSYY